MALSLSGFLFEDNYASQSITFEDFCKLAEDCDYAGVELRRTQANSDLPKAQRQHMARVVADHGLRVTCLTIRHCPQQLQERDTYFSRYLDLCHDLGCSLLKYSGATEWIMHMIDRATDAGVRVAINNHVGLTTETLAGTDAMLDQIKHKNFGLLFDPMHLFIMGEDLEKFTPAWTHRMFNVLCQSVWATSKLDQSAIQHADRMWAKCMPDAPGVQPWPAIATALYQHGYNGWVTVIENGWPAAQRATVARYNAHYFTALLRACGWTVRKTM